MLRFQFLIAINVIGLLLAGISHAETLLVDNGQPRAEIIIAHDSPRSTRLAAAERQTHIEKISGARLAAATEPSVDARVRIYVGESEHTEKLGQTPEGLRYGAYRIVSGTRWLALIGDDTDFAPIEPWARNNTAKLLYAIVLHKEANEALSRRPTSGS